jgi:cystathionine gamma-lyase
MFNSKANKRTCRLTNHLQPQSAAEDYPRKSTAELKLNEYTGFGTKAIHAGSEPDKQTGAVVTSISLATTFAQAVTLILPERVY